MLTDQFRYIIGFVQYGSVYDLSWPWSNARTETINNEPNMQGSWKDCNMEIKTKFSFPVFWEVYLSYVC